MIDTVPIPLALNIYRPSVTLDYGFVVKEQLTPKQKATLAQAVVDQYEGRCLMTGNDIEQGCQKKAVRCGVLDGPVYGSVAFRPMCEQHKDFGNWEGKDDATA